MLHVFITFTIHNNFHFYKKKNHYLQTCHKSDKMIDGLNILATINSKP